MRRSLTGIKPSGDVHLGNYLGSIRPALALQEQHEAYYFIADYHALTQLKDGPTLRRLTLEIAATWLALGLDPERTMLFRQSAIPEVCELTWVLTCQIPVGVLDRGHANKSAREAGIEINAGTLYYPILMAADILLYGSDVVPVGQDQKQHVEIARDIAVKVNYHFGEGTLVVPRVSITEDGAVVPGVDGRKMSKSYGNVLPLWARPKKLRKAVMRIVTDSRTVEEPKNPDTCTVFKLYSLIASDDQIAELRQAYLAGGMGYGHAKQALFEALDEMLAEPRERYDAYMANPDELEAVLAAGAARARKQAMATLERVRERVGLTPHVSGPNSRPPSGSATPRTSAVGPS